MNKHLLILKSLKERYKKYPRINSEFLDSEDDMGILHMLFSNIRKDTNGNLIGMKLTSLGLLVFNQYFKSYEFSHNQDFKISPKSLLIFDRNSLYPWYIDGGKLVLFDKKIAFKLKMAGNIEKLANIMNMENKINFENNI